MRALLAGRWTEGLPDPHRHADTYRVQVQAMGNLARIDGLFFVRERSLRTVWNYAREIGPRAALRKVASRSRERLRNEKYVSCGVGRVLEAPQRGRFSVGRSVVFFAPQGPACAERLVLPEALLLAVEDGDAPAELAAGHILHAPVARRPATRFWWDHLAGWSADSGRLLPVAAAEVALKEARRFLRGVEWSGARRLPVADSAPSERLSPAGAGSPARAGRKRAVLLGYGNYAKTIVLPNVRRLLEVDRIHEIDPAQIPFSRPGRVTWDTADRTRAEDDHDVHLIATYHHTHAPLAAEALRRGASAVVEKPIATSFPQLSDLVRALQESDGRYFACFQRRYLPLNDLARRDLGADPGDPISYHCIVYEVPLPARHWYRWPRSGSRLLSNGCHWIDHFLHLNDYCDVRSFDLSLAPDATVNASVTLENGAFFSMVLTDQGSERLGVRDHVELRANGATVRITDACRYEAEDRRRVLRSRRIGRLVAYREMYRSIAERIARGEPGDTVASVQRSASLVLQLESRLQRVAELQRSAGAVAEGPEPPEPSAAVLPLPDLRTAA